MAVTLTQRLQLAKPDILELMSLGDTVLSGNYDIIDLNAHQRIVANTSDVTTPYEGQSVYATVPAHNYVRKSGAWVQVDGTPPSSSGGARGHKGNAGDLTQREFSTGSVDHLLYSITFTAEAGRRYLIHYNVSATRETDTPPPSVGNGWVHINFRWNTGGTVNNTHTQIGNWKEYRVFSAWDSTAAQTAATGDGLNGFIEYFPNVNGQVTVGMFINLHASVFWWVNNQGLKQSSFHIMDWDN